MYLVPTRVGKTSKQVDWKWITRTWLGIRL